jgi:glycosyltransferase involved in cell wall biosynthesis
MGRFKIADDRSTGLPVGNCFHMRSIHLLRKYNPAQWGGTETAVQRLFDGLREQGVTSVVYCPRLPEEPSDDPLRASGHQVQRYSAFMPVLGISKQIKRQLISVGGNLMSFDLIGSLRREEKPSIIHTHTLGRIGGIALTVAKQRGVPFVVTIHGGVLDLPTEVKKCFTAQQRGWDWGRLFGFLFQSHRLFRDADAIITCNEKEASLLRERHPTKRIAVQAHGVPLAVYRKDQRETARSAFPQIRGKRVLLNVGRIDPTKNQGWLVDQAPEIFRKHPKTILVLAGACTNETYGETLKKQIDAFGLRDRVLLTGGLPPNDPCLVGLFQEAEVLLLPSLAETFGLVILEAWATDTMVLSSRTSGAASLLRNGQNGWFFDLKKPSTFHRALDRTLSKSELVKQLVGRGAEEVSRDYSLPVLAGRMKKLYEELIEERRRGALRNHSR